MSDDENELPDNGDIFTPLKLNTMSINGKLSGIKPNEKTDMTKHEPTGNIMEISSNYGSIINKKFASKLSKLNKVSKVNKTTLITKKQRKISGNGTHLSSQITFAIKSRIIKNKYYWIRLFQQGPIQIPGEIDPKFESVAYAINELINYLRRIYLNKSIELSYMFTSTQNYMCSLQNSKSFAFKLNILYSELIAFKQNSNYPRKVTRLMELYNFPKITLHNNNLLNEDNADLTEDDKYDIENMYDNLPVPPEQIYERSKHEILKEYEIRDIIRLFCGRTEIRMAEIRQSEDTPSKTLSIKFYMTTLAPFKVDRNKKPKKTTVNITQNGKINIDGGNNEEEVRKLYNWLEDFIRSRRLLILGNKDQPYNSDDDTSSVSGESLYMENDDHQIDDNQIDDDLINDDHQNDDHQNDDNDCD
jgi:hypothetical protein